MTKRKPYSGRDTTGWGRIILVVVVLVTLVATVVTCTRGSR